MNTNQPHGGTTSGVSDQVPSPIAPLGRKPWLKPAAITLWLIIAGVVLWAAVLFGGRMYLRYAAMEELKRLGTIEVKEDSVLFQVERCDNQSLDRIAVLLGRLDPSGAQTLHLWIVDTEVSDLSPLAGLSGLTKLYLYKTSVSDLSPLAGMKELKVIGLPMAQEVRVPPSLE